MDRYSIENDSNLARKQNSNSWHGHRHQRLNLLLLALCWIGTPLIHSKIGRWCNFAVKKSFTNAFSLWATKNKQFTQYKCIQKTPVDFEALEWYWNTSSVSDLHFVTFCCLLSDAHLYLPCSRNWRWLSYPEAFIVCMRRFEDADNKRRLYLHHFIVFIVSASKHTSLQLMNVEVSEGR